MTIEEPKTLIEAVRYFSDKAVCLDYMKHIKWPDGVVRCPQCGGDNIGMITTRSIFKCRGCRKQFSALAQTIFAESLLGLPQWFVGIWGIANNPKIGSTELARVLGSYAKNRMDASAQTSHCHRGDWAI